MELQRKLGPSRPETMPAIKRPLLNLENMMLTSAASMRPMDAGRYAEALALKAANCGSGWKAGEAKSAGKAPAKKHGGRNWRNLPGRHCMAGEPDKAACRL